MQKPETPIAVPRGQRGSVLVAVVAFSILIGIAATGYMSLSGSTTNHEATALLDAKAFHAAESGLLIGTRWLRDIENWEAYKDQSSVPVWHSIIPSGKDMMDVEVKVVRSGTDLVVQSDARIDGLGYARKRISWGVDKIEATDPGVFVNNLGPLGGVGGSGLNNTYLDGPFHSNTPIFLSSVSNPTAGGAGVKFVNGPVTTFNKTIHSRFPDNQNTSGVGHMGEYGEKKNNYDFGVYHHNLQQGTNQADNLDPFFSSTFTHSRDSLYMPRIVGQNLLLPQNNPSSGRAILYFDVSGGTGQATYYYHDAGGALQTQGPFSINNQVIRAQNEISVLGTVKGAATVVTDLGYNIYPVGDLKYDGFITPAAESYYADYNNSSNYGLGDVTSNTNILALASGADIHFQSGNKKTFNNATKTLVDATGTDADKMYVTAQLIAIENGMTTMFDAFQNVKGNNVLTRDSKDFKISDYNYTLRCIGSRTIDWWFSYDAQGQGNEKIRFFYDTRLSGDLKAPGVPAIQSGDGNEPLFRLKGDWREENLTS